jgi:hypothetical protein
MTLKQRRRHGKLVAQLDQLRKQPYMTVPEGYVVDENPEEDEKYKRAFEALEAVVKELHELEEITRNGN